MGRKMTCKVFAGGTFEEFKEVPRRVSNLSQKKKQEKKKRD